MNANRRFPNLVAISLIAALGAGCTGGDSGSSASSLSISGTLALSNSSSSYNKVMSSLEDISAQAAINTYTVGCATVSAPVRSGSAPVEADGSFGLSIADAAGEPLTCYLLDANGEKAADFLISDSSKKDMNGNAQTSTTAAFSGDVSLGSINFDANAGEVTVPATAVASVLQEVNTSAVSVFDPTGNWTIGAVDFTLPTGVEGPCSTMNCEGPPTGAQLYLKRWAGLRTSDSSTIYGLQVWEGGGGSGEAAFNACGSKIGLSAAQQTAIGVDFSANGAADAEFTFPNSVAGFADNITSTTGTVNLTDHWKMDTATTRYDMYPCSSQTITIGGVQYNGHRCGPDLNSRYMFNIGGGCEDSAGNPVQLNDWSGLSYSHAIDSNGIRTDTQTGTKTIDGTPTSVTCKNVYAVVNSSNVVNTNDSQSYNWGDTTPIASGTSCSDAALDPLQKLQCYSQYYWESGFERSGACLPQIDVDWSATNAADFVDVNFRPTTLVFMDEYKPTPDGLGGSLVTRQEHWRGVQVSSNNWVNCRVIETGALSLRKVSSTKLLATYQSSEITTSRSKSACVAEFSGSRRSFMFYLNQ